ncbi:phenylalanine--tRNA ligase subunit beta [Haloplasma contractile]|uniref:Phenylalanine--tRNA ligase beta subunit n=1 Tax=Haloplasma contractile SSD-17B TaxID=1033810 RepID=U2FRD1_9MOLU|nr:phenylalanine--tRNA ligase subunit beta [Haloplasma contractile]ERJ13514.1 Phenylalanine--tRNA ligase beta subunit protein [Haloplasma contractile SSD-17B]
MLVSLKWLQDYVDISDINAFDLAEKITRTGIEVEAVEVLSSATDCVIGYVRSIKKHPEADRLNICEVEIDEKGNETVQIICGAANIDANQKVIVAKIGAVLPGNFKIKKAKLRGVESYGMICSLKELGIENKLVPTEYQDGIYVLSKDAPVGTDAVNYLRLNDTVLEFGLTPNRADCLSMLGVAYEVAAILDREIKYPDLCLNESDEKTSDLIKINLSTYDCPAYYAKIIRDVKIKQSPQWLQSYLIASGIRPKNNIVDLTNYVMLELGQPLHAFDLKKLNTDEILVRNAKKDETIITLDGEERKLIAEDIVITDGEKPVALAGVMGGQNTEIDDLTESIMLESAVFRPTPIRKTSQRLGLRSDSSSRFEKKVDPNRVKLAIDRAAMLIEIIAKGETLKGVSHVDSLVKENLNIDLSVTKVNEVLGTSLTKTDIEQVFKRLSFEYTVKNNVFTISVPTRRQDITIKEDLIEEIARIYGYDHIEMTIPETNTVGKLTYSQATRRKIKRTLESCGMNEVITYSLTKQSYLNRFLLTDHAFIPVALKMPMSEERKYMRHSLLPHMLDVVAYNKKRTLENLSIYELSKRYYKTGEKTKETYLLAGVLTGRLNELKWKNEVEVADFFNLKGNIEVLFEKLGINEDIKFVKPDDRLPKDYHPGRSAYIMFKDSFIGIIGGIHPNTQGEFDLNDTYVFELELETLLKDEQDLLKFNLIPKYPSITRDIALVVDEQVTSMDLISTIKSTGKKLLKDVDVFDLYQGEHIETGKKSIAFSLTYLDEHKTLTDDEVTKRHEQIVSALEQTFNASLRK